MSAFHDYCIVCEKICPSQSAYCSEECKIEELNSHYEFNNVPQLISPVLHPRGDSIAHTLSSNEDDEDEDDDEEDTQRYMIRSPLLLTSAAREQDIAGLSLNNPTNKSKSSVSDVLATSANNYRKWLGYTP